MAEPRSLPPTCDTTVDSPAGPLPADAGSRDRYTAGRPGLTTEAAAGTPAAWRLVIPAPAEWLSANDRLNWATRARASRAWRAAAAMYLIQARPPKGLSRVRLDLVLLFGDRRSRDTDNYRPTAKAVVDAFGPPFLRAPSARSRGASGPGYGMIPNDDPAHLDGPHLHPGSQTWADFARRATSADLAGYPPGGRLVVSHPIAHLVANRRGGLVVVATDLSQLPAGRTWTPRLSDIADVFALVRRLCNGCGRLLGDLTVLDEQARRLGHQLPDVRDECPSCREGR
jgi:hypothetical protein